jgi:putative membrane protein
MNYRFLNSAVVSAALVMAPCTYAFGRNTGSANAADVTQHEQMFMKDMAQGNVAEVELGKLAQQKGSTAAVRDFGARMVRDHTILNNQLKQTASEVHMTLPTSISAQQQQQKKKLEGLSGQAFDKAYMNIMLTDHQTDVQTVQQEAENATNPEVKSLAGKTLPILEDHLRLAENDAGQLGISARKGLNEPEHPGEQARR